MTFEDYMQKMRDVGQNARDFDVGEIFGGSRAASGNAFAAELESFDRNRQFRQRHDDQVRHDTGIEGLGGSYAGDKRHRQDIKDSSLRFSQANAASEQREAEAKFRQNQLANKYDALAAQTGAQYESQREAQEKSAQLQREMQQVVMAGRALDRQHAAAMNATNNATQIKSIEAQTAAARARIEVEKTRIRAQMVMDQRQYGGGGRTMTAKYSTGASTLKGYLQDVGAMATNL